MSIDQSPGIMSILASMAEELRQVRADLAGLRELPAKLQATRTNFSVAEFAALVGKAPFTVRQWCLHGQVNAVKSIEKRGGSALWKIPADEHARYLNDGLLTMDPRRNERN